MRWRRWQLGLSRERQRCSACNDNAAGNHATDADTIRLDADNDTTCNDTSGGLVAACDIPTCYDTTGLVATCGFRSADADTTLYVAPHHDTPTGLVATRIGSARADDTLTELNAHYRRHVRHGHA